MRINLRARFRHIACFRCNRLNIVSTQAKKAVPDTKSPGYSYYLSPIQTGLDARAANVKG
jgi:hypothetical protein